MTDLDEEQRKALETIRETFKDKDGTGLQMNDSTFTRYLRARTFNIPKTISLLDSTISWRKSFGLEKLHTEWSDIIRKEHESSKMYVRGFDKEGHALVYMRPALENTNDHEGNMKNLVYTMERAIACMEATTGQEKLSLVIDYTGFSLSNAPPMKTSRETLSILQDHYPERLYRAYCIRPPIVFYAFFKVISPFMDSVTKQKLCMLTNADMAKPDNLLFTDVDRSVLEPYVGGEETVPFDPVKYLSGPFHCDFNAC